MATFFDQNGVEHALTPETQPLADAMGGFGVPPLTTTAPDAFGAPLPPAPAPAFIGTPSQIPEFSGVSPLTAAAPAPSALPPAFAPPAPAGLEVVDSNGATAVSNTSAAPDIPAAPLFQETTKTTSSGITGGALRDLNAAAADQKAAIGAISNVAIDKAAMESEGFKAKEAVARSFRLQEEAKQAEVETRKAEWEDRMKVADDKFRGANIDSGRLWRDSSTGSKVAAGIGIMLGALSQALTGKDNPALKIIDAAIDRDIDVQKANMEKAGKEAGMTRSAYSTYLEATGSEAAARNRIKMLALDEIGAKLDMAAANSRSPEIAANALASKAAIDAKKAELVAKDSTYQKITEVSPIVTKPTAAGTSHWNDTVGKDMAARKEVLDSLDRIDQSLANPEKAGEFMGPFDSAMYNAASKAGFKVPEEYTRYKSQTGILVASILKVMSGAGVSQPEFERWKEMLPTVDKNPENARAELKAYADQQRAGYENARASYRGGIASPVSQAAWDTTFPSYGPDSGSLKSKYKFGTPANQ